MLQRQLRTQTKIFVGEANDGLGRGGSSESQQPTHCTDALDGAKSLLAQHDRHYEDSPCAPPITAPVMPEEFPM